MVVVVARGDTGVRVAAECTNKLLLALLSCEDCNAGNGDLTASPCAKVVTEGGLHFFVRCTHCTALGATDGTTSVCKSELQFLVRCTHCTALGVTTAVELAKLLIEVELVLTAGADADDCGTAVQVVSPNCSALRRRR